jgi:transcriptional regulator with XRE-family HTH domain
MSEDQGSTAATPDTALQRAVGAVLRGQGVDLEEPRLTERERRLVDELTPWLSAWPPQAPVHQAGGMPSSEPDDTGPDDALNAPLWADLDPADPVAQMLGLIPNHDTTLDAKQLKRARQAAGLTLQDLVDRLAKAGWNVDVRQAFQWERTRTPLAPAVIDALAQAVRVDTANLLSAAAQTQDVFTDAAVQQALAQWAAEVSWDVQDLTARVRDSIAVAGQRNAGQPSAEAIVAIVTQLRSIPGFLT